jgi:hypothetical protein
MDRVRKSAQNILLIILIPKADDRRNYSIVERTKKVSVLPDKKYSKAEFLGACVVFSDFNAI